MTHKLTLDEVLARAERAAFGLDPEPEEEELSPLPVARPDITKLRNALDEFGLPVFSVGDKIVIERRNCHALGFPYLDTQTYLVRKVDMKTGDLVLWNEELTQWAMDNFIKGALIGQAYKLAGRHLVTPKRKRGRPRKNPLPEVDVPKVKGKRGRPPGSKNRPKEVIRAEKAALKAAKKLDAAKKGAKRPR